VPHFTLIKSGNGRSGRPRGRDASRVSRAAWAFTTRRVPRGAVHRLVGDPGAPQAGDLVLARVEVTGYHTALQLPDGRRKHLFAGDEIIVAYGNRYAPNQFEAVVPSTLGPCHLVASGGVAAKALSWHARVTKGPTQIKPIGLLAGASGAVVNLRDHALAPYDQLVAPCPAVVAVVGTAMDSGKTQSAAFLVKGLKLAGLRVGYAKITGTGAGGDTWLLKDAGANPVLDFTDAGFVSTYLAPPAEIERIFVTLVMHLARAKVDAIVLELADGVLQKETAELLVSQVFRAVVGSIVFAASDAMGAVAGSDWLRSRGLPLVGLSGVVTASPLQTRESAQATGLPLFTRSDLARPHRALEILASIPSPGAAAHLETPAERAPEPVHDSLPSAPRRRLAARVTRGATLAASEDAHGTR
jgi:hypothetical protein